MKKISAISTTGVLLASSALIASGCGGGGAKSLSDVSSCLKKKGFTVQENKGQDTGEKKFLSAWKGAPKAGADPEVIVSEFDKSDNTKKAFDAANGTPGGTIKAEDTILMDSSYGPNTAQEKVVEDCAGVSDVKK